MMEEKNAAEGTIFSRQQPASRPGLGEKLCVLKADALQRPSHQRSTTASFVVTSSYCTENPKLISDDTYHQNNYDDYNIIAQA